MCVVGMMIKARFGGRAFGLFTTSFVVDCRGDNGRDSSGRGIRGDCLRTSRGHRCVLCWRLKWAVLWQAVGMGV